MLVELIDNGENLRVTLPRAFHSKLTRQIGDVSALDYARSSLVFFAGFMHGDD
jgi:hypothetical protein